MTIATIRTGNGGSALAEALQTCDTTSVSTCPPGREKGRADEANHP